MPDPRLTAIITALMLSAGAAPTYADFSLDELQLIERLVLAKDTAGLGRLLATNPNLIRGEDPLARELRGFNVCYQTGRLDCFASPRVVRTVRGQATGEPVAVY